MKKPSQEQLDTLEWLYVNSEQGMSILGARDGNEVAFPTIIDEESFIDAEEEDRTTMFAPRRTSPVLV